MVGGVFSVAFRGLKNIFLFPCMRTEWAGASKQHAGKHDESCWAQLPCGRKRGRHRGTTTVLLNATMRTTELTHLCVWIMLGTE
jgi:hypothetical protein